MKRNLLWSALTVILLMQARNTSQLMKQYLEQKDKNSWREIHFAQCLLPQALTPLLWTSQSQPLGFSAGEDVFQCYAAPEISCLWTYLQINNLLVEIQERGKKPSLLPQFSPFKKWWMLQILRSLLLFFCSWLEADHVPLCPVARADGLSLCISVQRRGDPTHPMFLSDVRTQSSSAQISFQLECSKSSACNWFLLWSSVLQEELEYRKTWSPWSRTRSRNIYTNWTYTSLWSNTSVSAKYFCIFEMSWWSE